MLVGSGGCAIRLQRRVQVVHTLADQRNTGAFFPDCARRGRTTNCGEARGCMLGCAWNQVQWQGTGGHGCRLLPPSDGRSRCPDSSSFWLLGSVSCWCCCSVSPRRAVSSRAEGRNFTQKLKGTNRAGPLWCDGEALLSGFSARSTLETMLRPRRSDQGLVKWLPLGRCPGADAMDIQQPRPRRGHTVRP